MKINDNPFRPTPEIPHFPMKREGSLVESVKAHIKYKARVYGVEREDSGYPTSTTTSRPKRRRLDPLDRPRMRIDNMQPSWSSDECLLTPSGSNPHDHVFGYSFRSINSKPVPTNILRLAADRAHHYSKRRNLPPLRSGTSIHAVAEVNSVGTIDERTEDDVTSTSFPVTVTSHAPQPERRKKKPCFCDDCDVSNASKFRRR